MQQSERQVESLRLKSTIEAVDKQLEKAARENRKSAEAIRAIQEERMEENRMDIGGMGSVQGFADILELSLGTQALTEATGARENAERSMRSLVKMRENPYFARIDFRADGGEPREVYIGRATLMEDDTMQIHVYDWRVPIASVFYQYGVGPAKYVSPGGTVEGEVLLKRQYEIQNGELLFFFDANEEVRDSFLRELLSQPATPAMKSIVETIQRDQDRIIRDMTADLLLVKGCAGSGKTSVALHRVAYLMYQGLQKNRLSSNDILILAPNATFERYISQVLPDLGEEQVRTMLPEDMLSGILPGERIQARGAWVERWLTRQDDTEKRLMRDARRIKGSKAFIALLERFIHELPRRWIPFCDVEYDGQRVAHRESLRTAICNPVKRAPLGVRLRMLEKSVWTQIRSLRPARQAKLLDFAARHTDHAMETQAYARMLSIRESGRLLKLTHSFSRIDCVSLYRALFSDAEAFARLAAGLVPDAEREPLRLYTLGRLSGDTLPYEDAAAIAYLAVRVHGHRAYAHIRQVVVDEAQDLDCLHAALLGLLFPNARFTMLGDTRQTLSGTANPMLYEEIRDTLKKPDSLLVSLDKSFRCTREIWAFSAAFMPPGDLGECFSRSGEAPSIHRADTQAACDALLTKHARQAQQSGCLSVALLCKTERDAGRLYERLKGHDDVVLIGPDDAIRQRKISIVSLFRAKGLEFDAVLLCDVDAAHYRDEEDRNLLYIGCTRALHILRVFYTGNISPLLPHGGEVSE